jgi:hypothetical protein
MTEVRTMLSLSEDYLTQRRALGFDLRIPVDQITAFARFVDEAADLSPKFHPAMGRVPASFEPIGLGGATGRGAEPSV